MSRVDLPRVRAPLEAFPIARGRIDEAHQALATDRPEDPLRYLMVHAHGVLRMDGHPGNTDGRIAVLDLHKDD